MATMKHPETIMYKGREWRVEATDPNDGTDDTIVKVQLAKTPPKGFSVRPVEMRWTFEELVDCDCLRGGTDPETHLSPSGLKEVGRRTLSAKLGKTPRPGSESNIKAA